MITALNGTRATNLAPFSRSFTHETTVTCSCDCVVTIVLDLDAGIVAKRLKISAFNCLIAFFAIVFWHWRKTFAAFYALNCGRKKNLNYEVVVYNKITSTP